MERNTAMLENGPDFDRELLAAFLFVALPHADPGSLPLQLGRVAYGPAMRANRAIRPKGFLKVFKGLRFGVKGRF
jgi:hypothetical protein